MKSRLALASIFLLSTAAAAHSAAAQNGTAHVEISGGMYETFDLILLGGTYGPAGNLQMAFLGPNQQELYIRSNDPLSVGSHNAPPCADVDCSMSVMIVPSSDPPFGNLTTVSSTAPDHQNSCVITIQVADNVGVVGTFNCTFNEGRVLATGRFSTTSAAPPPASNAGNLEVGLSCDESQLEASGILSCSAAISNAMPGSQIVYDWEIDGSPSDDETADIVFRDLAPGQHTVGVMARDNTNNQLSTPRSLTVTRGGAPRTGGGGGDSGNRIPWLPLLAGGALAAAAALGRTIKNRSKNARALRPPPTKPAERATLKKPPPPPPRAESAALGKQPPPPPKGEKTRSPARAKSPRAKEGGAKVLSSPPKTTRTRTPERKEERREPDIRVFLHISPSIRTAEAHPVDKHLWGDGVDLVFGGFTVLTDPQWTVTETKDDWSRTLAEVSSVATFKKWPRLNIPFDIPSDERRVVIQHRWTDAPRELTVHLDLRVTVTNNLDGAVRGPISFSKEEIVQVVGANPQLRLFPDRVGDADGTSIVTVTPELEVFGTTYAGGLDVKPIENAGEMDPYFAASAQRFRTEVAGAEWENPKRAIYQRGYELRCKFHLDDDALKKFRDDGVPVRYRVEPTGRGPHDDVIVTNFDWMALDHFQAVKTNLKLPTAGEGRVFLQPSTIEFEKPEPADLPDHDASEGQYRTRIRAKVRSASGKMVRGEDIKRDLSSGRGGSLTEVAGWRLRFAFPASPNRIIRQWEGRAGWGDPSRREHKVPVVDVDNDGRLVFSEPNGSGRTLTCEYDHWKTFYAEGQRYLPGQSRSLEVSLKTDQGAEVDGPRIFIGPPHKLYVYADVGTLQDGVVGHVFAGLVDTRGREVRAGFHPKFWLVDQPPKDPDEEDSIQTAAGYASFVLFGMGAIFLADKIAAAKLAAWGIPRLVAVFAEGGAGGIVATGAAGATQIAGSYGGGWLRDEGLPDKPHDFEVCRSWDLTPQQYESALAKMQAWKVRSDTMQTWYDVTGEHVQKYEYGGNCCTFVARVCEAASVKPPVDSTANVTRPTSVGAALAEGRSEGNAVRLAKDFSHPWVYKPPPAEQRVSVEKMFGSTPPPRTTLTVEERNQVIQKLTSSLPAGG